MARQLPAGAYGKLPAHGDFLHRELPFGFVEGWDRWLQAAIATSQTQLGERWLDTYLTSPVWHFALSGGVIDSYAWLGVMIPSVDRVGRYFPFTLAMPLPGQAAIMPLMEHSRTQQAAMEALALEALEQNLNIDAVLERLQAIETPPGSQINACHADADHWVIGLDAMPPYAEMLQAWLQERFSSFSLWWTQGSEWVAPSLLVSRHLPGAVDYCSMLDGQWQQGQWRMPYQIQTLNGGSHG